MPTAVTSSTASARTFERKKTNLNLKQIQDKKLKGTLKRSEAKFTLAAEKAAQASLLLTEESGLLEAEGIERTYKFTQDSIKQHVDDNTLSKMFDLKLQFGPYRVDYTRNGKNILFAGRKGHVATFNWRTGKLGCEIQLGETVRDVKWLHNETLFAVAQKKYTFIYDQTGLEIHRLSDQIEGNAGYLKYRDISTGKIVAELRTGLGRCDTMTQNPANAIINLGHGNGTVTLWSPNTTTPLVKMLCHRGPVKSIAVDKGGYYMATAGLDGQLKIWDIRTYKPVHEYFTSTPASTLAISDIGALAVGYGPHIAIWQDALKTKAKSPYLTHLEPGSAIDNLQFCPFEDMLAFGHSNGIKSLIVPGTGEPNFDSLEANPYQTKKQRQESEVHSLLDKIQPEMITIDVNFVGNVDRAATEVVEMERKREWEANHPEEKFEPRNKQRGKSSAHKKFRKKQTNVIDANKVSLLKKIKDEGAERELAKRKANGEDVEKKWSAFDRFAVAPMK